MKIVFTDIDGVLNWCGTEDRIEGFYGLCPERIQRLNHIFDAHPDAKIVISSTWRRTSFLGYPDFRGLKALLAQRGVRGEIIDMTPIRPIYQTRGAEIKDWLEQNKHLLPTFVILDDDTSGMGPDLSWREGTENTNHWGDDLRPFHVVTHWTGDPNVEGEEGGLLDKHIDQAIKVLNGEKLQ